MIEYLEKRLFVYRKSCNYTNYTYYYTNLSFISLAFKALMSLIGSIGPFYLQMLSILTLFHGVIELFEKTNNLKKFLNSDYALIL